MNKKKNWLWISPIIVVIVGFGIGYGLTQLNQSHNNKTTDQVSINQPTIETIQPNEMDSNIDAVNYKTVEATKSNGSAEIHIVIEGNADDVSKFVVPYVNIIKDLNKDISDVVLKIYSSQENFDNHKPSWEYKNGIFTVIQEK